MSVRTMVADDCCVVRLLLTRLLNSLGIWDIVEARDGEEAIQLFHRQPFDLVLTDWNMPGKTGLEVIQAIRASGSRVPIVMVTSEPEKRKEVCAIQAGASDFLAKPLKAATLRDRLARHLNGFRSTSPPVAPKVLGRLGSRDTDKAEHPSEPAAAKV